jgi:hypothetical protein
MLEMTPEQVQAEVMKRIAASREKMNDTQRVQAANRVAREKLMPVNYRKLPNATITPYRVDDMPEELATWAWDLVKRNMQTTSVVYVERLM